MMEEAKSAPRPAESSAPPARKRQRESPKRPKLSALKDASESDGARRLCALILEVLAGVRSPSDAAGVIGVSLPRYYALEAQALEGLLRACERRPRGPQKTPERECERLRRQVAILEREGARQQALLRAQGRTVGIPAPAKSARPEGKRRRRRRPSVRALRAAKALGVSTGSPAARAEEVRSPGP
jgi:hypothetical protein